MADDSHEKTFLQANRLKIDFRGFVLIAVFAGIVLIVLAASWAGLSSFSPSSWWSEDGEQIEGEGKSLTARHIIYSVEPTKLTHWNDANRDGKVQSIERELVELPIGCYAFTASDTRTKLSHDGPAGPYHDLGSILLLNGKLRNEVVRLTQAGAVDVSFYPFGTKDYPKVESTTGFQLVHINIYPTECPQ